MLNLSQVERLSLVVSRLNDAPSSLERNDAIAELSKRISSLMVCDEKEEESTGGGIAGSGDVEIHGNVLEPPVRPAENLEECRRRLQQVIKGLDPEGQFLVVAWNNREELVIKWRAPAS